MEENPKTQIPKDLPFSGDSFLMIKDRVFCWQEPLFLSGPGVSLRHLYIRSWSPWVLFRVFSSLRRQYKNLTC